MNGEAGTTARFAGHWTERHRTAAFPEQGQCIYERVRPPASVGCASPCGAAVSARALAEGRRCILYADLGNPTSNGIYRSIGYRAVVEALRYRFA